VAHPLPSPAAQLANLIGWLKAQAGDAHFATIAVSDQAVLATIVGAVDDQALRRLLQWAANENLIETTRDFADVMLTPKAWESAPATEIRRPEVTPQEKTNILRGHCPECGPNRLADVVKSHQERRDHDEQGVVWTIDTYNILKCRGCETVYVPHENLFSEDEEHGYNPITGEEESTIEPTVKYWPAPARRKRPDWLDEVKDEGLRNLLEEVYAALDADQRVLAAIGTRTVLDRAMVLRGADEAPSFAEKLKELKEAGVIGQHEKDILEVLTDAGSAAAHRGWRPTPHQLTTIMDGTETFLYRALILGDAVTAMKGKVPERAKRQKTAKGKADTSQPPGDAT
jgi:hypothetical protein